MDCGPASLKSLLEGFGRRASYGRLREACQTDVDGTSIDALEDTARRLGLDAEQIMLPSDHLLLGCAAALPAIVVMRLPSSLTHFVVVWACHGRWVQVMDPACGRRWLTREQFLGDVYLHQMAVDAAAWRDWAGSEGLLSPLSQRLAQLGVDAAPLVARAEADPSWRTLGALDAATRLACQLERTGALPRASARRVIPAFCDAPATVPDRYWTVQTAPQPDQLILRGAVLVRVRGTLGGAASSETPNSPQLAAALEEPPSRPGRELWRLLRADGLLAPGLVLVALTLTALAQGFEALLLRSVVDLSRHLGLRSQRVGALAALVAFGVLLLVLDLPIVGGIRRLGRRLEARLRVAFLSKLPRLGDRYLHSRPTSDMAARCHAVHTLRELPAVGERLARAACELLVTACGIAWLYPRGAVLAFLAAALAVVVPVAIQRPLIERDLRVRVHAGSLASFYLDAMLGLVAVRTHSAETAVRREHEGLLVEWWRASRSLLRAAVAVEGLQLLSGFALSAWLLYAYLERGADAGAALLLAYWALNLPALGQDMALALQRYPTHRNHVLRLLEPLGAPDEDASPVGPAPALAVAAASDAAIPQGVSVRLQEVSVRAAGHLLLDRVNVDVAAGEHIAIVGASGAGKSTLLGLLLGWHRAAAGQVLVDGRPLEGRQLQRLRRHTAWVDPEVQLWNRPFLDNLRYGTLPEAQPPIGNAIEGANLRGVVAGLPDGLQTRLGENGGLVSGGEGQRVRLGRALLRSDVRLVVLDEAFRGLDRDQRRALLSGARQTWPGVTLVCVTHDVAETYAFPRVLVVDGGRIVEDGSPGDLAADPRSRYRALLDAEQCVREALWQGALWRRLRLEGGTIVEER
jgi:ATP-binding cassette subfamily B protein